MLRFLAEVLLSTTRVPPRGTKLVSLDSKMYLLQAFGCMVGSPACQEFLWGRAYTHMQKEALSSPLSTWAWRGGAWGMLFRY